MRNQSDMGLKHVPYFFASRAFHIMKPIGLLMIYGKDDIMADKMNLGRVVATKRVWDLVEADERFRLFVGICVSRFLVRDWGNLCDTDWELNDNYANKNGGRILASYKLPDYVEEGEESLWIILDKDEMVTTILFPGDY